MRLILPLLLTLSSCSIFFGSDPGPQSAKGKQYSVNFGKPQWIYRPDERSDYVFEHQDGRIMLSNSFCEEFQDQPLDQLARRTFNNISHYQSSLKEYTTFKHREAYRIEGAGEVDGVQVKLKLLNTRRNNCYFDFLAITPESIKEDDKSFEEFLDSVVFR